MDGKANAHVQYMARLVPWSADVTEGTANRSATLLFLGIVYSVSVAGRGLSTLLRTLWYRSTPAAAAAKARDGKPALLFPPELVQSFLACILVLLRHREWGQELQPVHDAIEAEMERLKVLPRGALNQQAQQETVQGPGGVALTAEQRVATYPEFVDQQQQQPTVTTLQAFAGAAKTTMLRSIVRQHRHLFFVYLVFNKDAQEAGDAAMVTDWVADGALGQPNFAVCTTHAVVSRLARVKSTYPGRALKDLSTPDVRAFLAARWSLDGAHLKSAPVVAVRKALACFMTSADPRVEQKHLPPSSLTTLDEGVSDALWRRDKVDPSKARAAGARLPLHSGYSRGMVVQAVQALWDEVRRPGCRMSLPHNAYLKEFALSRGKLRAMQKSDDTRPMVVLLDEAQDLNAVTKQIFIDNQDLPVVMVGDRHQQIYSFNFACGLMAGRVPIDRPRRELALRQTFRFGHEIAAAVNTILKAAFMEPSYVVGRPTDLRSGRGCHPGVVYALVPRDKTLDTVTHSDLDKPAKPPKGSAPPPAFRKLRYVQCPLLRPRTDPRFPTEFPVSPMCGVALLPADWKLPALATTTATTTTGGGGSGGGGTDGGGSGGGGSGGGGSGGGGSGDGDGDSGDGDISLPLLTYVGRTNAALIRAALELVALGRTVYGSFGGEVLRRVVGLMRDVAAFLRQHERNWSKGHLLHGLANEEDLKRLVEEEAGGELATAYALARECQVDQVENLEKKLKRDRAQAEFFLVTSHKMKGDEAPVVQVADDFLAAMAPADNDTRRLSQQRSDPTAVDELDCVYVAATRARSVLLLSRDLSRLVLGLHRRHVELVLPEEPAAAAPHIGAGAGASPKKAAALNSAHTHTPASASAGGAPRAADAGNTCLQGCFSSLSLQGGDQAAVAAAVGGPCSPDDTATGNGTRAAPSATTTPRAAWNASVSTPSGGADPGPGPVGSGGAGVATPGGGTAARPGTDSLGGASSPTRTPGGACNGGTSSAATAGTPAGGARAAPASSICPSPGAAPGPGGVREAATAADAPSPAAAAAAAAGAAPAVEPPTARGTDRSSGVMSCGPSNPDTAARAVPCGADSGGAAAVTTAPGAASSGAARSSRAVRRRRSSSVAAGQGEGRGRGAPREEVALAACREEPAELEDEVSEEEETEEGSEEDDEASDHDDEEMLAELQDLLDEGTEEEEVEEGEDGDSLLDSEEEEEEEEGEDDDEDEDEDEDEDDSDSSDLTPRGRTVRRKRARARTAPAAAGGYASRRRRKGPAARARPRPRTRDGSDEDEDDTEEEMDEGEDEEGEEEAPKRKKRKGRAGQEQPGAPGARAPGPACSMCGRECVSHPQARLLPRVTWRGQPVCRECARGTVFAEVLDRAEAQLLAGQGAAAGAAAGR